MTIGNLNLSASRSYSPRFLKLAQADQPAAATKTETTTTTSSVGLITPEELAALPSNIQEEIKGILNEIVIMKEVSSLVAVRDGLKDFVEYLTTTFAKGYEPKYRPELIKATLGKKAKDTDANFEKAQKIAEKKPQLDEAAEDAAIAQIPELASTLEAKLDAVFVIIKSFAGENTLPNTKALYRGRGIMPAHDSLVKITNKLEAELLGKLKATSGDMAIKLLKDKDPGFDPAEKTAFNKLTQPGVKEVIGILTDRVFALKNSGITIKDVTPKQIVPGRKFQIVVTGDNLGRVKGYKMPAELNDLPFPEISDDGQTMTFEETSVPANAKPGVYTFELLGEPTDPDKPNSGKKLGEFSVTIVGLGDRRFSETVRKFHIEAVAGVGHRFVGAVSPLAKAEMENNVPSVNLRVGLAPQIVGKEDEALVASRYLRLRADGYFETTEAVTGAGAGVNAGVTYAGITPELGLRYDLHKYDYSAPNLQFFNGSSQQLTGRAALKGNYHEWLGGGAYGEFTSDWRNYDSARLGDLPFSGRDQALKFGLTANVDLAKKVASAGAPILTLDVALTARGFHTVPETYPGLDDSSKMHAGGYSGSLKADWAGYKALLPYAVFGYQKETLATFLDNEHLYAKVGTGTGSKPGHLELSVGKMNQNHYYPFGTPFYAQAAWTEPWLNVISLGVGYDRLSDQATGQKFNAVDVKTSVDLYRAAEKIWGTKQIIQP